MFKEKKMITKIIVCVCILLTFNIGSIYAAEQSNPCNHKCPNQEIGKIKYCNNSGCTCEAFDYENQSGYCNSFDAPKGIVFKVCDCDRVDEFDVDKEYSIGVVILTPGVYWAPINPSVSATPVGYSMVAVTTFEDENAICIGLNGNTTYTPVCSYRNANKEVIDGTIATCSDIDHNTGYNPVNINCSSPPVDKQAVCISTVPAKIFDPARSYILVDIPAMYYDNSIVSIGDEVKVSIIIRDASVVCATCPGICSCVSTVGIFGCVNNVCNYDLPYLISQSGGWWTGIAISNTSNMSNIITIKFHDGKGHEAVYTSILDSYALEVNILDYFLSEAVGDDLTAVENINAEVYGTAKSQTVVILGDATGFNGSYGYVGTCCCK